MALFDCLLLVGFSLICTLLYFGGMLLVPVNRRRLSALGFGAAWVILLCAALWYTVFAGPFSRNWGLGGSYLWMAVCPALYLVCGVTITLQNVFIKEE